MLLTQGTGAGKGSDAFVGAAAGSSLASANSRLRIRWLSGKRSEAIVFAQQLQQLAPFLRGKVLFGHEC
jgi:hypothetical protein